MAADPVFLDTSLIVAASVNAADFARFDDEISVEPVLS